MSIVKNKDVLKILILDNWSKLRNMTCNVVFKEFFWNLWFITIIYNMSIVFFIIIDSITYFFYYFVCIFFKFPLKMFNYYILKFNTIIQNMSIDFFISINLITYLFIILFVFISKFAFKMINVYSLIIFFINLYITLLSRLTK